MARPRDAPNTPVGKGAAADLIARRRRAAAPADLVEVAVVNVRSAPVHAVVRLAVHGEGGAIASLPGLSVLLQDLRVSSFCHFWTLASPVGN